jgi:hypothetical protein
MENQDKLADKIFSDRRHEAETEGVELKGEDSGETGILKRFVFQPHPQAFDSLDQVQILKIVEDTLAPQLWAYCKEVGWWPKDEEDPYTINPMDDGTYMLNSFLQSSKKPSAKFLSEFGKDDIIGINEI